MPIRFGRCPRLQVRPLAFSRIGARVNPSPENGAKRATNGCLYLCFIKHKPLSLLYFHLKPIFIAEVKKKILPFILAPHRACLWALRLHGPFWNRELTCVNRVSYCAAARIHALPLGCAKKRPCHPSGTRTSLSQAIYLLSATCGAKALAIFPLAPDPLPQPVLFADPGAVRIARGLFTTPRLRKAFSGVFADQCGVRECPFGPNTALCFPLRSG